MISQVFSIKMRFAKCEIWKWPSLAPDDHKSKLCVGPKQMLMHIKNWQLTTVMSPRMQKYLPIALGPMQTTFIFPTKSSYIRNTEIWLTSIVQMLEMFCFFHCRGNMTPLCFGLVHMVLVILLPHFFWLQFTHTNDNSNYWYYWCTATPASPLPSLHKLPSRSQKCTI